MTFTTTVGTTTIKTTLYGEVTPERLIKERARATHQAEQLNPVKITPTRTQRPRRDAHSEDAVWDKQSYQSTGR
jgi:hypothetical protein